MSKTSRVNEFSPVTQIQLGQFNPSYPGPLSLILIEYLLVDWVRVDESLFLCPHWLYERKRQTFDKPKTCLQTNKKVK